MFQNGAQKAAAQLNEVPKTDEESSFRTVMFDKAKEGAKAIFQAGLTNIQHPQIDVDLDLNSPLKAQLERKSAVVKLEQMSHGSIVFSLFGLYFSAIFCLVIAITLAVIVSQLSNSNNAEPVNASLIVEGFCRTLAVLIVLFLFLFFTMRITRYRMQSGMPLQQEQALLIVFLIMLMLTPGMSVYSPYAFWNQFVFSQKIGPQLYANNAFNLTLGQSISIAFLSYKDAAAEGYIITSVFAIVVISFWIFYFGLTSFYFGQVAETQPVGKSNIVLEAGRMLFRLFFHSQRRIVLCSMCYTVIFVPLIRVFDMQPSQVPFMGMISVFKNCPTPLGGVMMCSPDFQNGIGFARAMIVAAQFVYELMAFWYLHRVGQETTLQLKALPYESCRAKHLGYKFFTSNKRMMYFFVFLSSLIVVSSSGIINESFFIEIYDNSKDVVQINVSLSPLRQVGITYTTMGFGPFYLLLASFLFAFSYAYLPPDSQNGFMGFFCGGKKRSEMEDSTPIYITEMAHVAVIRAANQKLIEEERRSFMGTSRRNIFQQTAQLPVKRLKSNLAKLAKFFKANSDKNEECNEDNEDLEVLERQLDSSSDLCYQVNSNFFCLETEVLLLNFAFMAYWEQSDWIKSLPSGRPGQTFRYLTHIENKETEIQCHILESSQGTYVVSFRGTSTTKNIWQDLDYIKMKPLPFIDPIEPLLFDPLDPFQLASSKQPPLVHRGFYKAYLSVRDEVLLYMDTLLQSSPQEQVVILCSGHSLGGALASHFAAELSAKYPLGMGSKVGGIQLSTFGSPRVGNFAYTSRVNRLVSTIHRFVIGGDPVPKLPPSQYLGSMTYYGFQHVGVEILMDVEKINVLIAPQFIEKQLQHAWGGYVPQNHLTGSYVLALALWSAKMHATSFVPEWWLPVVNHLLQFERERLERVRENRPALMPSVVEQLEKEGAITWSKDQRPFQSRGCETEMLICPVCQSHALVCPQCNPVEDDKEEEVLHRV